MTIRITIACDHRPCAHERSYTDVDTADAERAARKAGWFTSAVADYCPQHAPKMEDITP